MERRDNTLEVRADENRIRGTASVYYNGQPDTQFELWHNVVERIQPGAFENSLEADVIACFNHDQNLLLGRTPNTLRLWADDEGLQYEIEAGNTQAAKDVRELIKRGDIKGSS